MVSNMISDPLDLGIIGIQQLEPRYLGNRFVALAATNSTALA